MIVSPALYLTVNIASNISLERERGGEGGRGGRRKHIIVRLKKNNKKPSLILVQMREEYILSNRLFKC